MGLPRIVLEPSRNHLFSQRDELCCDGGGISLFHGTKGGADCPQAAEKNSLYHLPYVIAFVRCGLRAQCIVSHPDYLLIV